AATDEIRAETEVGLVRDDEAEDEAESNAKVTIDIRFDRVVEPDMLDDSLVLPVIGDPERTSRLG
nr:hypothetical protein [Tanacetum cinerariifolium]